MGELWRRSLILLSGQLFVQVKRRVVWVLEAFLLSTGPFCASGVGALWLKGSPCGGLSLVESLGWRKEVGVPVKLRRAMGWVYGRKLEEKGPWCLKILFFFVGDGRRMRFWKDKWCGNNSLCDSFPSLYALAYSKDAWVADCRDPWGEEGEWNLWFSRPFNDWEVKAVERFLLTLQGKRVVIDLIGCFGKRLRTRIFLLNPFISWTQ